VSVVDGGDGGGDASYIFIYIEEVKRSFEQNNILSRLRVSKNLGEDRNSGYAPALPWSYLKCTVISLHNLVVACSDAKNDIL
jgi:hypothetical protein